MKHFLLPASALVVLLAMPAEAATMKAEFRARVSSFYDGSNVFGGETADVGDEITLTYLYDPDLALPNWRYEGPNQAMVYGGTDYDDFPYAIPSPVLLASVQVGSAVYSLDATRYGSVNLAGGVGPNGPYTYLGFDARADNLAQLSFATAFNTETPSVFLFPSLSASYSFAIPWEEHVAGSFNLFRLNEFGGYVSDAQVVFNVTHASISPYIIDPTDPGPAPVPLPAGAPLVLTGLAALTGLRLRKRG